MTNKKICPFLIAVAGIGLAVSAAAQTTVPCNSSGCIASITTPNVSYTLTTSDDGTNFYNTFTTSSTNALDFANIYFDTNVGQAGENGSNLGFEITNDRAFIPGVNGVYYDLSKTGVTFTDVLMGNTRTISLITPNSFFLNDPTGIPFAKTLPGGEVTVHYSQAFDYTFVGGSNNYTLPNELGGAIVNTPPATPEPAGLEYMALAGLSAITMGGRRLLARIRR